MPLAKDRKKKRAYIGIDIGGTKSLYALFDERVPVADLRALTTIYRNIIDRYFAGQRQ